MTLFLTVSDNGTRYQRFYPHIDKLLRRCPYRWRADCRQELILCSLQCQDSAANLSNAHIQTYISRRYRQFIKTEYEWRATKGTELGDILAEFDAYFQITGIEDLSELAAKWGYQVLRIGQDIVLKSSMDKIGSNEPNENDGQLM